MLENTRFKHWHIDNDADNISWLSIDVAGKDVNVLNSEVLIELEQVLQEIVSERPSGLIIQSAKASGFIAGADINEFTELTDSAKAMALIRRGQSIFDILASVKFPTLCLINGFCLGGGFELALACRYRIATDSPRTKIGLPEILLGIHPGFGGTVRLTKLIGGPAAMNMMLSGRAASARVAKRLGMVDHVVPERLLNNAGRQIIAGKPPAHKPSLLQRISNSMLARPGLAYFIRKEVMKRVQKKHYPAPFALIDMWKKYGGNPSKMMREEAASVAGLLSGSTAQNLVRVFFLQEELKALGHAKEYNPEHVHVIGGGIMGGDIAAWCVLQGFKVTIQDFNHDILARVVKRAETLFKKKLKQPHLVRAALDRLIPDIKGSGVSIADVVIEAIFENVEAKQELFRGLEPKLKPDALLATNTSSIPLETLGEALKRPKRLVGLHFFNPVAKMQLVEVVQGKSTDDEAVRTAVAFTRKINRLPLPVKSSPGFLVNRILMPYLLEAVLIESEGVSPLFIDRAAKDFGMPMGPIELIDTVGLDICLSVADFLSADGKDMVPERLREQVAAGHTGRKSGRGFYKYIKGKPVKAKPGKKVYPPPDLADRLIMRMLNEVIACQREKIVEDEDLLDAGMIFGTGFAPFYGGPCHYIKTVGQNEILKKLQSLQDKYGDRFTPDKGFSD